MSWLRRKPTKRDTEDSNTNASAIQTRQNRSSSWNDRIKGLMNKRDRDAPLNGNTKDVNL